MENALEVERIRQKADNSDSKATCHPSKAASGVSVMWFLFFAMAAAGLYLVAVPMVKTLGSVPGSIVALANAIKSFEGWLPGSRSVRNNNPGNLRYTSWTKGQGALRQDDKGFAVFPDYQTGWNALIALLVLRVKQHPDWSILDLFFSYAPPSENDTQKYAAFVAKHIGGDVTTKLGELV